MNLDELLTSIRPAEEPSREVIDRHRWDLMAEIDGSASVQTSRLPTRLSGADPRDWPKGRKWAVAISAGVAAVGVGGVVSLRTDRTSAPTAASEQTESAVPTEAAVEPSTFTPDSLPSSTEPVFTTAPAPPTRLTPSQFLDVLGTPEIGPGSGPFDLANADGSTTRLQVVDATLCIETLWPDGLVTFHTCPTLPTTALAYGEEVGGATPQDPSTFSLLLIAPNTAELRLLHKDGAPVCDLEPHPAPELGSVTLWTCEGSEVGPWDLELTRGSDVYLGDFTPPSVVPDGPLPAIGDPMGPAVAPGIPTSWGTDNVEPRLQPVGRNGVIIGYLRNEPPVNPPTAEGTAAVIQDENGIEIGRFVSSIPVLDSDSTPNPGPGAPLDVADVVVAGDNTGLMLSTPIDTLFDKVANASVVSSGLARPDFYNWDEAFTAMIADLRPGIPVVVAFGGNDLQRLIEADGSQGPVFGDPAWSEQYQECVQAVIDTITGAAHPLVWIGVPQVADATINEQLGTIRAITMQTAEGQPAVTYMDLWTLLAGPDGGFTATVPDTGGTPTIMRSAGQTLTAAGAAHVAVLIRAALG